MAAAAGSVASVVSARHKQAHVAAAWASAVAEKRVVTAVSAAVADDSAKSRVKDRDSGSWVPGSVEAVWTI